MLGDSGTELRRGCDVGRVAQDEVEAAGQSVAPVAATKLGPRCDSEPLRIPPRDRKRRRGTIDADAGGVRPLVERGEQQRPRAGAEAENAARPGGAVEMRSEEHTSELQSPS